MRHLNRKASLYPHHYGKKSFQFFISSTIVIHLGYYDQGTQKCKNIGALNTVLLYCIHTLKWGLSNFFQNCSQHTRYKKYGVWTRSFPFCYLKISLKVEHQSDNSLKTHYLKLKPMPFHSSYYGSLAVGYTTFFTLGPRDSEVNL